MFIGEYLNMIALVLPLMLIPKWRSEHFLQISNNAKKDNKSTSVPWYVLGFGGFLDVFGSGFQMMSILLMPTSIWQMLRNGVAIFVSIFTVFYLKKPLSRHNLLAVMVLTLGFLLVGSASLIKVENENLKEYSTFSTIIGLVMLTISLVFSGFQFTYQEKMFHLYEFEPKRMVGAESVVGIISLTLLLCVSSLIDCPNVDMCDGKIDDPSMGVLYILRNKNVFIWSIIFTLSIAIYNLTGIWITKYLSSIFRIILDSLRTIFIWILSIVCQFEMFNWKRFSLQGPGFLLLILGNAISNEILPVPYFGFDRDLRKNKKDVLVE